MAGGVTNVQNTDDSKKQNKDASEETKTYYQTIAEEYDAGKITDESIKEACEKKGIDPGSILVYCKMTNLEREMSPYYKSDLSAVKVQGTDYNGTLKDGEKKEIAGCTITAKTYKGDAVKDTDDVFGLEVLKAEKLRSKENSKGTGDYIAEFALGWTGLYKGGKKGKVSEDEYMPSERTLYHCSSPYLGEFDYDPTIYRIGYKEVKEKDGTVSQLPVLQYINKKSISNVDDIPYYDGTNQFEGTKMKVNESHTDLAEDITQNLVPRGCKVLDYTFQQSPASGSLGSNLQYVPKIPEGVESAHCAFLNCNDLEIMPDYDSDDYKKGNVNKTRDCVLPSTLANADSMFKGCSSLSGTFHSRDLVDMSADEKATVAKIESVPWMKDTTFAKTLKEGKKFETVDSLPHGIVCTTEMFSGCEGLDTLKKDGMRNEWTYCNPVKGVVTQAGSWMGLCKASWTSDVEWNDKSHSQGFDRVKFGGELTPYLAPDMMRGIYDDISDSTADYHDNKDGKEKDGSYFKDSAGPTLIDKDGKLNTSVLSQEAIDKLDKEKLSTSQGAQVVLEQGKVDSGHFDTSAELASDGERTNNKCKDREGNYYYDSTGRKQSIQDKVIQEGAWWEKASMMLAVGGTIAAVGKGVTGNKWAAIGLGVGGVTLLDKVGHVFPKTLYPVVNWTANILPSPAKEKLHEFADSLPGAETYKLNEEIEEHNKRIEEQNKYYDNDYNLGKENYSKRMTDVFGTATKNAYSSLRADNDVTLYMKENAKAMVQELSFASMAICGEDSSKCVYDTMNTTVSEASNSYSSKFAGKTMSEADKNEVFDYYKTVMSSLETLNTSALENIQAMDGSNAHRADLQRDGLEMSNRAYTAATIESLKELDSKLHFMDDAKWKSIESMNISGVDIENIRNYDAKYFDTLKFDAAGKTVKDMQALSKSDSDFKKAMGDELDKLESRIPEGWEEAQKQKSDKSSENETSSNTTLKDAYNKGDESAADKASSDDKTTEEKSSDTSKPPVINSAADYKAWQEKKAKAEAESKSETTSKRGDEHIVNEEEKSESENGYTK